MPNTHFLTPRLKLPDQIFGGAHRPVPPARAAKGDGEIGPSLMEVVGKHKTEKLPNLLQIGPGLGILQEELRDLGIKPCQGPQLLLKMGIGETAEIEDEIGIRWEAVSIPERNKGDCGLGARSIVAKGTDQ